MTTTFKVAVAATCLWAVPCFAGHPQSFHGTWCFYEQSAGSETVPERVTISFNADGSYVWSEALWKQKGRWNVEGKELDMTDVGSHAILRVDAQRIDLERSTVMRLRRGACR